MNVNPKLSTPLATAARSTKIQGNLKSQVLLLYRNVQKQVPHLLSVYGIDADIKKTRAGIKKVFSRHGMDEMEPKVANMLVRTRVSGHSLLI